MDEILPCGRESGPQALMAVLVLRDVEEMEEKNREEDREMEGVEKRGCD